MCHLALARYLFDMLWRAELEVRDERDLHKGQLLVDCPDQLVDAHNLCAPRK
jgi:hypothetical protein